LFNRSGDQAAPVFPRCIITGAPGLSPKASRARAIFAAKRWPLRQG
jgi:hypothetical protein